VPSQANQHKPNVVILDDEPGITRSLKRRLERSGYDVITAGAYQEYTEKMIDCDSVLCDIILPDSNGLQALAWTRQHFPYTPVILMTGQPTYETAAEAIRLGAFDYLSKPVDTTDLLVTLERAIKHRQLIQEKRQLELENEAYRHHLEEQVQEKTDALRESQEFLTTLTNTMADVVISLTPDLTIQYLNQAISEIFGYHPAELTGQRFVRLFIDDSSFNVFYQKIITAVTAGNSQLRVEQPMRKKDGSHVTSELVGTFLFDRTGQVSQIICVVRDVSQRSFLFGVVAHELRSPLSLMTGFLQVLLSDMDSMDQTSISNYLSIINTQSARMLHMLDEFLDVTKIEFGEVTLNIEPVNFIELVKGYRHDFTYLADKKDIVFKESYSNSVPVCQCDPNKIGEVVANLLDNSIKYSNPGTKVELIVARQDNSVWFGVKDTGAGIKPDELQHLFKGFSHKRISTQPTAGELSTGLGLAICKRIIEAHLGEIGVDSTPGEGSLFWFSLPLKAH
jgi:two-component system phosphate regulon sensor histidine kinase PhoR